MTSDSSDSTEWREVPRRALLTEDTYHILREALVTNRLSPGQRLNMEQLAQDLNVSITPIRHALVRLASEGFVKQEPYKGYIASPLLDRETVAEIFQARILLETDLAAIAAKVASSDDIAFLSRVARMNPLDRFDDPNGADGQAGQDLNCDAALHRRIAQVAGNKLLVEILDQLNKRMLAYRSFRNEQAPPGQQWSPPARNIAITKREHRAIVSALKDGDPNSARDAMRVHLENASQRDIDPVRPR